MIRPIIVFFITVIAKKTEGLNPFAKIHGQFTAIAFSPYGRRTSFYVHKRERIGISLQYSRPIPKPNEKNAAMRH